MKKKYTTSLKNLNEFALFCSNTLFGGEILGLVGDLGSGKTTFVKKLCKLLKVKSAVLSPSFTIMNIHQGKLSGNKQITILHLDLYRIKNFAEFKSLGITEFWGKKNFLTVIEWADKIKKYLPKKTSYIYFQ